MNKNARPMVACKARTIITILHTSGRDVFTRGLYFFTSGLYFFTSGRDVCIPRTSYLVSRISTSSHFVCDSQFVWLQYIWLS